MMHQFKVIYKSNNQTHDFIMNGQATLNKTDGEVLEAALIHVAQSLNASHGEKLIAKLLTAWLFNDMIFRNNVVRAQ